MPLVTIECNQHIKEITEQIKMDEAGLGINYPDILFYWLEQQIIPTDNEFLELL